MFGFGKSKTTKIIETLVSYAVSGQSFMYKLFIQALEVPADKIRKIELTYFTLSVLTYVFLRFHQSPDKEQILDDVALSVIKASIPNCDEEISLNQAVNEYQERYKVYDAFLRPLLSGTDGNPKFVLSARLFYCVTRDKPTETLLAASHLIAEYILDHIDFIKKEV